MIRHGTADMDYGYSSNSIYYWTGMDVFVSGVFKGLEKVIVIVGPIIKDVTSQAKRYVNNNIAGNNAVST
jgi:hypothetical protein